MDKIIICSNLKCKHRSQAGTCRCKRINLSLNGVNTVNQGYQDYLRCGNFELDEEYKKMKEFVDEILGGKE